MNFLLEATWNRTCAAASHSSIRRHEQAYGMDHQQIVNGKTIAWKKFQNGVMLCATRQADGRGSIESQFAASRTGDHRWASLCRPEDNL
jgi:hypothetical protein